MIIARRKAPLLVDFEGDPEAELSKLRKEPRSEAAAGGKQPLLLPR